MSLFQEYYINTLKKNYANFEGRARRSEYWYFLLFNFLISFAIWILMIVGIFAEIPAISLIGLGLIWIFAIGMIIPSIAVAVRRLHDTDKSGWMLLIGLIPLIGTILLIVFYATEGTSGSNMYGPNPKEIGEGSLSDHLLSD